MREIKRYQNKKVLVLGAGLSGIYGSKLLNKLGAQVVLNDNKPASKISNLSELKGTNVKTIFGRQDANILDNSFDLLLKSPGIPYENPVVEKAQAMHLPIIVEVELASEINDGGLINVTGSNGKTTTVMLITRMINNGLSSVHAYDAGNIGISASKVAEKLKPSDIMVMEISSFMLLGTTQMHPHISVITNIFANHLDYHKTRANYARAKLMITKNQTPNDYLVMNFNTQEWQRLSHISNAKVIPFCTNGSSTHGAYEKDGKLYFRHEYIMDAKDINIHGQYNVENALAAIAVAKIKGCSNQGIVKTLTTFKGASNRNQYVLTYQGRKFFNDSKSTDIDSTKAALESFKEPVILLAGGLDRGYQFDRLVPDLKKYVKGIVLFGQSKRKMLTAAKKAEISKIKVVNDLDEAVPVAYQMSSVNNVILLSPANASWDQYPNFEVRGKRFVDDVKKLVNKKKGE